MTLLEGRQELGDVAINIQKFRVLGGFCCHPDQKNRGNPHCWSEDPKYWNGGWKEVPRRVQQNFKSTMYYVLLAVATEIVMPLFSPTYEISHEHTGRNEITSRTLKAKVFGKCSSHNSILYDTESSTEKDVGMNAGCKKAVFGSHSSTLLRAPCDHRGGQQMRTFACFVELILKFDNSCKYVSARQSLNL